jgi:hypothetical protein
VFVTAIKVLQRCLLKSRFIAIFVLVPASIGFAYSRLWTPSASEVAAMEANIKLEQLLHGKYDDPSPLNTYARYYSGSTVKGEKVILGELLRPVDPSSVAMIPEAQRKFIPQHAGVNVVPDKDSFPQIEGGGCGVVNLVYSVKDQKVTAIGCNGAI